MTGSANLILWIAGAFAAMSVFVLALLGRMISRRAASGAARIRVSRQTLREFGWTAVWALAIAAVAIPFLRLVYLQDTARVADVTVKVTGRLWHWTYEYPDHGNFSFDVAMLGDATLNAPPGEAHIVVPVGETVRIVTVGTNLIYSWAIPAIGVKVTGLPGRTNESWFKADKEGVFYGECTELCTLRHTFKPVEVEVVSRERFDRWVAEASLRFAADAGSGGAVPSAQ